MSEISLYTPLIAGQLYESEGLNPGIDPFEEHAPPVGHSEVFQCPECRGLTADCGLCYSNNQATLRDICSRCTFASGTSSCTKSSSQSISPSKDSVFGTPEYNPQDLLVTASADEDCIPSSSRVVDDNDTGPSTSYSVRKTSRKFSRYRRRTSTSVSPMPLSRVIKLAASFFFIYSAMNSISEYVTSLLPDSLGDESLFLLQTTLCASTLAAPSIVSVLGELRAMMLGGTTHVIYLAVLMQPSRSFVLGASALCGFGASASWVAQGTYLTRCSPPEKRGLFTGVFWGIYYVADIVGNLTAYTLFKYLSQNTMFAMGACSALVGVLLLLFMEERDSTLGEMGASGGSNANSGSDTGEESLTFGTCERCGNPPKMEVLQVCRRSSWGGLLLFLLLTPMLFYAGCESAFWTGEYTKLLPTNTIGLVLLCTGLGQFLGSFLLGWLSDFFHCHTPTFLVGVLASATGLLTCLPLQKASEEGYVPTQPCILGTPVIAFLGAFSFGVADGVLTTHSYAITGRIFPGRKPEIWAVFNLLSNGGAASTYWFGMIFPVLQGGIVIQLWAQALILTVGTPLYIIVDIWSASQATLQMHMFRRKRTRRHRVEQSLMLN
ncbi:MFS transporter, NAG-T family, sugar:H+ symporter [Marchantia polymorpha subsp. ruderalis]|uniref:UNC93-like protein MFSD11 n=2 Tax=Marchantia polymorpha TaxID=3197 RepID=A0AAF6B965_MARPO|nr:hypothetical protein MARPO_0174s0006 [Marchantia polymorpha]BBN08549.1 hypothetical protein Mp_4g12440 [Marchantia polymorpha subsp. ruderalis]|eukprot:PTQ28076.1 hypothetical protein MARPO_0174s0006 [Marchantia polymorpha]